MYKLITDDDINFLLEENQERISFVISGMTSLINDTENKAEMLENQKWYQRMSKTLTGKNKMTKEEIKKNHDRINVYLSQAVSTIFEMNRLDHKIILSLGNHVNQLYVENIKLKQMMGAFVEKLNAKIESIDNFHMLNTEIEQGIYNGTNIVSLIQVISQMDARTVMDDRKNAIILRSLSEKNIISEEKTKIHNILADIVDTDINEVGELYLECESVKENFLTKLVSDIILRFHFLSELERGIISKKKLIKTVLDENNISDDAEISYRNIFESIIESKKEIILKLQEEERNKKSSKFTEYQNLYFACNIYDFADSVDDIESLSESEYARMQYYFARMILHYDDIEYKEILENSKKMGDLLASAWSKRIDNSIVDDELIDQITLMAETGDVAAQVELYYIYRDEQTRNEEKALKWLNIAAENGYFLALNILGNLAEKEKDYSTALQWYRKAAEIGDAVSTNMIGKLYWNGCGVEASLERAKEYFEKAASLEYPTAIHNLGVYYEANQNNEMAYKYYHDAAEYGYADAMYKVGDFLDTGKGIRSDKAEAMRWYKEAAENNNVEAQYMLGVNYHYGMYLSEDSEKSKYWLIKAKENGHPDAAVQLALWYNI